VSVYKPEPTAPEIVENYKGFSVRKCKRGFLAFKDGHNLMTQPTVEDAVRSVDEHLERELKWILAWTLAEEERTGGAGDPGSRTRKRKSAKISSYS
jgi:hypothetical protein